MLTTTMPTTTKTLPLYGSVITSDQLSDEVINMATKCKLTTTMTNN